MSYEALTRAATVHDRLDGSTVGTVVGTEQYRAGGPFGGKLFDFNGGTRIEYPRPAVNSPCSFACWAEIDANGATGNRALFGHDNTAVLRAILDNATRVRFRTTGYDGGFREGSGAINRTPGNLYHLSEVFNEIDIRLYINAVLVDVRACGELQQVGNPGLWLGQAPNFNPTNGGAADFVADLGAAWTPAEVATLMAGPQQASSKRHRIIQHLLSQTA